MLRLPLSPSQEGVWILAFKSQAGTRGPAVLEPQGEGMGGMLQKTSSPGLLMVEL